MDAIYEPASDFLKMIVADEIPLSGSALADLNLEMLIALTRDAVRSNRDWATMLLAQQDVNTPQVRQALLLAASDADQYVSGEAILGLTQRDRTLALPFVQQTLKSGSVCRQVFEAAGLLADPSLVESLRDYLDPSDDPWLDELVHDAVTACETGVPLDWPPIIPPAPPPVPPPA